MRFLPSVEMTKSIHTLQRINDFQQLKGIFQEAPHASAAGTTRELKLATGMWNLFSPWERRHLAGVYRIESPRRQAESPPTGGMPALPGGDFQESRP
jgi:hypothetical protein